jgi:hypothetical protein
MSVEEKVIVVNPIVDVSRKEYQVIDKTGTANIIKEFPLNNYSDSQWQWTSINPSDVTTVTTRSLKIRYDLLVVNVYKSEAVGNPNIGLKFPCYDSTGNVNNEVSSDQENYDVFLSFAGVQQAITSAELRLNGVPIAYNLNQYLNVMPYLITNEEKRTYLSADPLQSDNSFVYKDPHNAITNSYDVTNPGAEVNSNGELPNTRASYKFTILQMGELVSATAHTYYNSYQVSITTELFMSPLLYGKLALESRGFTNLSSLQLTLNMDTSLMNCLSCTARYDGTNQLLYVTSNPPFQIPGTSITVSGLNFRQPTLLLNYITQDPIEAQKQPEVIIYDHENITSYTSSLTVNPVVGDIENSIASIRFQAIPKKLILAAQVSKSWKNTDVRRGCTGKCFLRQKRLDLTWQDRQGLFASFSEVELWVMSVKNGLKMTFYEWKNTGSIVIIDVAKDIGLASDECVGMAKPISVQYRYTVSATPLITSGVPEGTSITFDMFTFACLPQQLELSTNTMRILANGIDVNTLLSLTADSASHVDSSELKDTQVGGPLSGGSLYRKVHRRGGNFTGGSMVDLGAALPEEDDGGSVTGGKFKRPTKKNSRVY